MAKAIAIVHQSMRRKSGGVGAWADRGAAVFAAGAGAGFILELIVYIHFNRASTGWTPLAAILYKVAAGMNSGILESWSSGVLLQKWLCKEPLSLPSPRKAGRG